MVRRYYRRYPRSNNRDKYSVEQTIINTPTTSNWTPVPAVEGSTIATKQFAISVIPPTTEQGMRKVKHFTITVANGNASADLVYALVYVPMGYEPNSLNVPEQGKAISMYEPNQFVISQGVLDFAAGPTRIKSPLSRNLNSGDSIYLILSTGTYESVTSNISYVCTVKYAITLQ